jgi:glyoxylase-like metal-dependent hydrolase (beta-lactamase superfamily II)
MATQTSTLTWDVFVAPAELAVIDDLPPRQQHGAWSPISATLIMGERDAVLVDPLMTTTQAQVLGRWVAAADKKLTTVYITHGHGDHFFGLSVILDRFPDARALATPAVVELMRDQASPETVESFWVKRFPGQIPQHLVIADALDEPVLDLEGHDLVVVDLGHTDTDHTTCLHVPDVGLVVAGDAAYNDVHLYLAESPPQQRREWIAALDAMEGLDPRFVIAGHKRAGRPDHPRIIEETRQYIRDFDRIAASAATAGELYEQVLAIYPDRVNPDALWTSVTALKPTPEHRQTSRTSPPSN